MESTRSRRKELHLKDLTADRNTYAREGRRGIMEETVGDGCGMLVEVMNMGGTAGKGSK